MIFRDKQTLHHNIYITIVIIIITINSPEERTGAIFDGDNYQTNLVLQPSLSCYLSVCDVDQVQGLQGSMVAQGDVAPGGSGQSSQLDDPQSTVLFPNILLCGQPLRSALARCFGFGKSSHYTKIIDQQFYRKV